METRTTSNSIRYRNTNLDEIRSSQSIVTHQRLNSLLELNAKTALEKMSQKSERERLEAGLMRRPLDTNKTFSYFGLMLGTFRRRRYLQK